MDWFQRGMLRDSDGDCASSFLEEPSRQSKRQQREQQRQQPAAPHTGGSSSSDGDSPAPKQQKGAVLQVCATC